MSTRTRTAGEPQTYRLSPPDRTGWMFGLNLVQLLICGFGVAAGIILMQAVGVWPGLGLLAVCVGLGAVKIEGMTVVDAVPHGSRFLRSKMRGERPWFSVVPLLGGDPEELAPSALADHDVIIVDGGHVGLRPGDIAISRDRETNMYAATLRVAGRQFALVESGGQETLLAQWGIALQAFINERTAVSSVRWSEWAAPAGLEEHRRWLKSQLADEPLDGVYGDYQQLLGEAGSQVTRHEVLVTVTVNANEVRVRKREDPSRMSTAVNLLLGEIKLFAQRLEAAELVVEGPLSPQDWARAVRLRLDPSSRLGLDSRVRALGDAAGGCSPENAAPLAAVEHWDSWQTDGTWHRALYVSEWPRIDVTAGWMNQLIGFNLSVRSVNVFFEPISREKSRRSIKRDSSKITADSADRAEKGLRVGADYRRAAQAVEDKEEELVAGYGEFSYAGIVVVSANSADELADVTDQMVQAGGSVGLDLRALNGRHDQAVCATLPIARGLLPRQLV